MRLHLFRTPSVDFGLALIAGIVAGRLYGATSFAALLITVALICLIIATSIPLKFRPGLILFAVAGFLSILNAEKVFDSSTHISNFAPTGKVTLKGTVKTPIDYYPQGYRFRLQAQKMLIEGKTIPVTGLVVVNVYNGENPPLPGDRVSLKKVRLKPVTSFRNFGGFDYERFMKDRGIGVRAGLWKEDGMAITKTGSAARPDRFGEILRRYVSRYINDNFPENLSSISSAMVVGVTGGIDSDTRRRFIVSGLAHLLAVSGLHVGFVSGFAYLIFYAVTFWGFFFLRKKLVESGFHGKPAAIAALIAGFLFVLSTGSKVSAKRAGIMIGIYLLSALAGRGKEVLNALALSAIVVLLLNPTALFSASFVLSYIAVLAIIFLFGYEQDKDENPLDKLSLPSPLTRIGYFFIASAKISVVVGIATAPVVIWFFHEVHGGGLFANLLAVPMAAVAVPSTLVGALINSISPTLGSIASNIPILAFGGIDSVTKFFSKTDILSFAGPAPAGYLIFIYYATLLSWFFRSRLKILASAVLAVALLLFYWPYQREATEVHFFDVGQGESTLLMLKNGKNILIDGGVSKGRLDAGEFVIVPALHRLGVRKLDAVIATHGDSDHVGGLWTVLKRIEVEKYFDNGQPRNNDMLKIARRISRENGASVSLLRTGMEIPLSKNASLKIIHPSREFLEKYPDAKDNDLSLAMMFTEKNSSLLLAGDIEKTAENFLLESGIDLKADILKVPHHGSNSSSTAKFLKMVQPKAALIGVGRFNRYRLPAKAVIKRIEKRGIKKFLTKDDGEIVLRFTKNGVEIFSYGNPEPTLLPNN